MGLQERLEQLKRRYVASLPGKQETLAGLLTTLEQAESSGDPVSIDEAAKAIRAFAHRLAGSGASYGFLDISDVAAATERARGTKILAQEGQRLLEALRTAHEDAGG